MKPKILKLYLKLQGGKIYYRAIGRPWGPAADFIQVVTGPWHRQVPSLRLLFHPLTAFKFESGRQYSGPPSEGRPPKPSVCPTVRPSRSIMIWKPVEGCATMIS